MSNKDHATTPSGATRAAEEAESHAEHEPDRPPSPDEEQAAPDKASAGTEEGYEEMTELGAKVKGEGELP